MKVKINIIITFFLGMASVIYAQPDKQKKPKFYGNIKMSGTLKDVHDTIAVGYQAPYTLDNSNWKVIRIITDDKGNFSFTLPKYAEPAKMRITAYHNGTAIRSKMCFFENTDSINVEINKSEKEGYAYKYSGIGSEKYTIANGLENLRLELRNETPKLDIKDSLKINLLKFSKLASALAIKKDSLIEYSGLSSDLQNIVRCEYGDILFEWSSQINYRYVNVYRDNPIARSILKNGYNEYRQRLSYRIVPEMKLCPIYLGTLATRASYDLLFSGVIDSVEIRDFYQALKTKYSGQIREQILANVFINAYGLNSYIRWNQVEWDSLLRDSEKLMTIPSLKSRISSVIKKSKGSKLFDVSLLDLNDNLISTQSLKGKVVLLDIWTTGCSWCAIFHKDFHEKAYPSLKDEKDFVYLSIGAFNDKKRWIEGIKSGKYTADEYLNVRLEDLLQSPFGKYYSISGLPFMLLIDKKGNIYGGTNLTGNSATGILQLIDRALKNR